MMRNGFKGLIESSSLSHILCQKVAYDAQRAIVYPCLRMNYAAAMWKVSRLPNKCNEMALIVFPTVACLISQI